MRMHHPAHPGELLREMIGDAEVKEFAERIGVERTTLSRLLNRRAGVSALMALRLEAALGATAEFWMNAQTQHDLWQARTARPEIISRSPSPLASPGSPASPSAMSGRHRSSATEGKPSRPRKTA